MTIIKCLFRSAIIFLFFFALAKTSLAACAGASPNLTAASPSYADVNDCVQAGTYGDTIRVPAGSANWPDTLTITRGCWLQGAGKDATIITSTQTGGPEVAMLSYAPDSDSITNNIKFKVSGFKFDGGPNFGTGIVLNGPISPPITNMIITDNLFTNLGNVIVGVAAAYGVIYKNIFYNCSDPFRDQEHNRETWDTYVKIDWTKDGGPDSDCRKVTPDLPSNTSCFMYFEDNYVYWGNNLGTWNLSFQETGHAGRFVIRYNTDDFSGINKCDRIIDGTCWANPLATYELHDSRRQSDGTPDDLYAPMGAIVYGNLLKNDMTEPNPRNYYPLWQRGGKQIAFFTYLKDVHGYGVPGAGIVNQFPDSPVSSNESVQHANDTYIWGNLYKDYRSSSTSPMSAYQVGDACYGVTEPGFLGSCMNGSAITSGTATGGGSDAKSFTDSTKNFTMAGVRVGNWVVATRTSCYANHALPDNGCYYARTGCQVASISTTVNPSDTLNCSNAITYQIIAGDEYYVVPDGAGMRQDHEWWTDNQSCTPSSCTSGIGCGSILPSGPCTTEGVGYWYTTQGNCGNLDGWVGRIEDRTGGINTKIQGTLYRCTSGIWQAYWTPYAYPHPLRNEGGSDTTPPAAPTGLAVN